MFAQKDPVADVEHIVDTSPPIRIRNQRFSLDFQKANDVASGRSTIQQGSDQLPDPTTIRDDFLFEDSRPNSARLRQNPLVVSEAVAASYPRKSQKSSHSQQRGNGRKSSYAVIDSNCGESETSGKS
jgi:hypothetical protein